MRKKFSEFNWIQNIITDLRIDKNGGKNYFWRDGYYYYNDSKKENKPYYNSVWNDKSSFPDSKYTTVFSDLPHRGAVYNNVYWLASLSLVANTKNGHETLTNFYYGFRVDNNFKVDLIKFGQSGANPYWYTNVLLGFKF